MARRDSDDNSPDQEPYLASTQARIVIMQEMLAPRLLHSAYGGEHTDPLLQFTQAAGPSPPLPF